MKKSIQKIIVENLAVIRNSVSEEIARNIPEYILEHKLKNVEFFDGCQTASDYSATYTNKNSPYDFVLYVTIEDDIDFNINYSLSLYDDDGADFGCSIQRLNQLNSVAKKLIASYNKNLVV